jgi:hypothetical protein
MEPARDLKGARFAVWKNPENLTERQQAKLAEIQKTNGPLYRAYLLKEQLRQIYRVSAKQAEKLLEQWLAWARRSRLPSFVKLASTITAQRGRDPLRGQKRVVEQRLRGCGSSQLTAMTRGRVAHGSTGSAAAATGIAFDAAELELLLTESVDRRTSVDGRARERQGVHVAARVGMPGADASAANVE